MGVVPGSSKRNMQSQEWKPKSTECTELCFWVQERLPLTLLIPPPPALDNPQPLLSLFLVLLPHSGMAHGPWRLSFLPHGPSVPAPSPATLTAEPLTLLPFPLSGSSAVSPSCAPATENFADRTVPLGDAAGRYTEVVTEVSLLYLPTKKKIPPT